MERLTITLPAEQRAFVKAQIASGQYATESEVVATFNGETLRFLPRDITLLDAANSTLEELSRLFGERLISDQERLRRARIFAVTVKCASGPGQWACWEWRDDLAPCAPPRRALPPSQNAESA